MYSLNIEFPDRLAFLASNNILASHVSGHCSLLSRLFTVLYFPIRSSRSSNFALRAAILHECFQCNRYCCHLPDDCFVRSMKLSVADKCVWISPTLACVAWRFWLGALSNIGGRSGGRGRGIARRLGLRRSFARAFARVFAASPLSSAPDKTAMLRRLVRLQKSILYSQLWFYHWALL